MASILIEKLPAIFVVYFHREGVIHQLKALKDSPMTMLTTPKQEVATPPVPVAPPTITPDPSQRTPNSTRKCV